MNYSDMNLDDIQARRAEIAERREAINAEVDTAEGEALTALETEVEKLNTEERALDEREAAINKAVEEREKQIQDVLSHGKEKRTFEKENTMTNMEIRDTHEYIEAFANYVRTGKDTECRSLLTENVSGVIPVPTFVGEIVAATLKESKILNRIRRSYFKGNLKVGFEIDAPAAGAHTEGGAAMAEEALDLGIVTMVPTTWKKWLAVSDEVLDNADGEAYLRYVYEELARGIVKARENAVVAAILAAPQTATATAPAVQKTGSALGAITDIVDAIALLGEGAEDLVVICSPSDYATLKGLQMASGYGADPFDGLEVIKCAAATVPIVGDLKGVQENLPNGDNITIKYDDKTDMKSDLVNILGRMPSAIEVVGNDYFAKVSA